MLLVACQFDGAAGFARASATQSVLRLRFSPRVSEYILSTVHLWLPMLFCALGQLRAGAGLQLRATGRSSAYHARDFLWVLRPSR